MINVYICWLITQNLNYNARNRKYIKKSKILSSKSKNVKKDEKLGNIKRLSNYKPISFSRFTYNMNANNPPPIIAVMERLRQVIGPFDSLGFLGGSEALLNILVNP
jgi:hypothetical protein